MCTRQHWLRAAESGLLLVSEDPIYDNGVTPLPPRPPNSLPRAGKKAVNVEDLLRARGEEVDNRLSKTGVTGFQLAAPTQKPDGTVEIRPQDP